MISRIISCEPVPLAVLPIPDWCLEGEQFDIGSPEISTDGLHYYKPAIRDAFGSRVAHGVVHKTYSVTHLNVNEASRRYSPATVIAVEYDAVSGVPSYAWARSGC